MPIIGIYVSKIMKVFERVVGDSKFNLRALWICVVILLQTLPSKVLPLAQYPGPPLAIPKQDSGVYSIPGDINIGALMPITQPIGSSRCSDNVWRGSFSLEYSEAIAFAVKRVNENPKLLPNVTLGFVELNDCFATNVAVAKALSFLPRMACYSESGYCNSTTLSASSSMIQDGNGYQDSILPHYDVIGVLSSLPSDPSIAVAQLFATAQIPLVGPISTTDELSDKYKYPYFVRVHAPDRFQMEALLGFIESKGWSYVSVIYQRGSYGEVAFDNIKENAPDHNVCIATYNKIDESTDFDIIVEDLLRYPRARVVLLIITVPFVQKLFDSIKKFNSTGHFIWVGTDSWASNFRNNFHRYQDDVLGSFSVLYYSKLIPEFYEHIQNMRINNTENPWFKPVWEGLAGCSLDDVKCDPDSPIITRDNFGFYVRSTLYMDAVLSLANAAHDLIAELCPNTTEDKVRNCIQGDVLMEYLKNISFTGYNGNIYFDKNGDMFGKFEIRQIVLGYKEIPFVNISSTLGLEARTVAVYDVFSKTTNDTARNISWDHFLVKPRIVPLAYDDSHPDVPESVCSGPCAMGEFKIQREPKCCWDCQKCRDNEKLINGNTSCQACEDLTWPDPDTNMTSCRAIPLSYPSLSDTLPVIQISLASAAIICASFTVLGYIYYRHMRVIKAASRELSILQMVAMFVGYVTVLLFQTTPTSGTCGALFFLFCLSFAGLYSPLLVKTVRIYRIFQSGTKNNRRPRFVSPTSQLVMASVLIGIQVLLCIYSYAVYLPTARTNQPVRTEKYVELSCDMTLPGLASFLTYNLVLVSLCSIFAFKTRKLPDNFNESRFISMCVSTTLVIWLAFIPTYFTATQNFVRVLSLSGALLLNHSVALVFLFVPKIYAAVYMPPEDFVTNRFQTTNTSVSMGRRVQPNRIAPSPTALTPRE